MYRIIFYLVVICLVLLISITIFLVILNWNDKVKNTLLPILLIGTATTLATVLLLLRDSKSESSIVTSIVYNVDDKYIPNIPFDEKIDNSKKLQDIIASTGINKITFKDKPLIIYDTPKNINEIQNLLKELILYQNLKLIADIQYHQIGVSQYTWGVDTFIHEPIKVKGLVHYKGTEFLDELNKFRFLKNPSEKFGWERKSIKLPKGTKIIFDKDNSKLILKKNYYFEFEIMVKPFGSTGKGNIPATLKIPKEIKDKCSTFTFQLNFKVNYDKLTAGNWKKEEYEKWIDWIIEQISNQFSDEFSNST